MTKMTKMTKIKIELNRISKRYKDPAKAYSNQSPVTKRNGHTPAPTAEKQQQPQSENRNDERRRKSFQILKMTDIHT